MNSTKRIISITLILCLINVFISNCFVYAADLSFDFDIRTYDIFFYNQKTGYITDVNESEGRTDVVIPEAINGVDIVGIGSLAFSLYSALQTVQIPDSITDIADNAFESSNPIIKCNHGSYAEKWAKSHGVLYDTGDVADDITTYALTVSDKNISIDESVPIMAVLKRDGNDDIDVNGFKWTSSDRNVVDIITVNEAFPANDENVYQSMAEIKGVSEGTATVTVKYKDAVQKCKITVSDSRERGFDITRDGWPFPNAAEGFKYGLFDLGGLELPSGPHGETIPFYEIPLDRYIEVYGESIRPFAKFFVGNWGGNCFGMCALAYKIYNGDIAWDKTGEVNENGYDVINTVEIDSALLNKPKLPSLKPGSDLCNKIERYQIAQSAMENNRTKYQRTTYKEMFEYVEPILETAHPISISVHWTENGRHAGHQLLVDTSRGISKDGNWRKLYLYDPNNPHYDNNENLNLPTYYGQWDDRYIDYNISTGEWYMDVGVTSDKSRTQLHKEANSAFSTSDDTWMRFEDFDDLPNNFDQKLHFMTNIGGRIFFGGGDTTVTSSTGKTVFSIKSGKINKSEYEITYINEGIYAGNDIIGYIDIDLDEFILETTDNAIAVIGNSSINAVETDGNIIYKVNQHTNNNELTANTESNITLLSENVNNSKYNAQVIMGTLEKNSSVNVNYDDTAPQTSTTSNNKFNVVEMTNIGDTEYTNVDLNDYSQNGDNASNIEPNKKETSFGSEVSSWAKEEVEEAYNDGLIPDVLIGEDLTEKIDRAEFAAISVQLYEELTGNTANANKNPFSDILSNKSKNEILKAYSLGITAGMTDTTFEPTTLITREQLATMLCRTIKKYSFDGWTLEKDSEYYLDTSGVPQFADDKDISEYAKPSVYYMAKFGIIKGVDDTHFAPKNTTSAQEASGYAMATREQAIALSLRIFKLSDMWK